MFDWNQHLRETAAHLVRLSQDPAFREHAKWRAQQLAQEPLYRDLAALIRELREKAAKP